MCAYSHAYAHTHAKHTTAQASVSLPERFLAFFFPENGQQQFAPLGLLVSVYVYVCVCVCVRERERERERESVCVCVWFFLLFAYLNKKKNNKHATYSSLPKKSIRAILSALMWR